MPTLTLMTALAVFVLTICAGAGWALGAWLMASLLATLATLFKRG